MTDDPLDPLLPEALEPRPVLLFTRPDSPECDDARRYLAERDVPFVEHDVTGSASALEHLLWLTGVAAVPAIVVGTQALVGFDPARIEEMLSWASDEEAEATPNTSSD